MNALLLILAIIQSACLCAGQVLLKLAMASTEEFSWTWHYFYSLLTNWRLAACGLAFAAAGALWMYILKHYAFGVAYPLSSLAYLFGMLAALWIFHEPVSWAQWLGVVLIMSGCALVVQ